jgi:hypothetical protein
MAKQKIQNYLHELIKNLSQTEKRYFKLLAKQQTPGKKNDYIKLFEAIDKQKVFNEGKIKEQFKGTPIEKRYASLKKYLYELVIKSLTFYNSETISSIKVRRMLDAAEILQRKGLYHQAIRKLDKAEKMAEEVGLNFVIHDITRLKISCKSMISEFSSEEEFIAFKDNQTRLIARMAQTNKICNKGLDVVFYSMYARDDSDAKNIKRYKDLVDNEFLTLEKSLEGGYNKHQYFYTLKRYYSMIGDSEKQKEYNQKHIDVFEKGDMKKKHQPSNYIHSVMTVLESLDPYTEKEEIEYWVNHCDNFFGNEGVSYFNKANDQGHLHCIQQTHALLGKNNNKVAELENVITDYLIANKSKMNTFAGRWLNYNLAWTKIYKKDYKEALRLSNELVNNDELSASHFLYSPAIIQNIIIHFELKNFSYLEFAIGSFYKALKKRSRLTANETLVFDFFYQNLSKVGSSVISNQDMFARLKIVYEATAKNPLDFTSEYLIQWINAKAGNQINVNEKSALEMG